MFRDGSARLLVFRVGTERFAIELAAVDEVIDAPPVHALPDAGPSVLGVASVREALITIYDPRPLLGVPGTANGAVLLFVREQRRIGLAIDDVYDAIVIEPGDIRPAPGVGADDGILLGVVRRGDDLLAVLNVGALLAAAAAAAADVTVADGERP